MAAASLAMVRRLGLDWSLDGREATHLAKGMEGSTCLLGRQSASDERGPKSNAHGKGPSASWAGGWETAGEHLTGPLEALDHSNQMQSGVRTVACQ